MEYNKLTKIQKLAGFLILIGPEGAAEIMNGFDNAMLETICREMVNYPLIPHGVQRQLMQEFSAIIAEGTGSAIGGVGVVQEALGRAKGDYAASALLSRFTQTTRSDVGDEIRQMDGLHVLNLVKTEQPQTIAFIISSMDPPQAAQIIQMLSTEMRENVIECLGGMEATSLDSLQKVTRNLTRHVDRRAVQQGLNRTGGVKACADLLNSLDKEMRKALITRIEERNALLGTAIRKKIFSFEDLTRLSAVDLQRVLRDTNSSDLPIALKSAKPAVTDAVLGALSKRAAEGMREEIDMLPVQRAKDAEAAQDRIIQVVRKLEEAEEITTDEPAPESNAS